MKKRYLLWITALMILMLPAQVSSAARQDYDPLAETEAADPAVHDLVFTDGARMREIPIRVYLPGSGEPLPVILFSHGLGGSRSTSQYLGRHWSRCGYAVVYVQHAGSDAAALDVPAAQKQQAIRDAVTGENLIHRVKDISAVLDKLETWQAEADHPLHGRLDLERVGIAGHSFGAKTAQWLTGENTGGVSREDERLDAAVIFSPNFPFTVEHETAFAGVDIPWLLMTGTADDSPTGAMTAEQRMQVYEALPPGDVYQLVLSGAGHFAFTQRGPTATAENKQRYHRAILALSTAFWDSYLKNSAAARDWLQGGGPASVLTADDRWQKK